MLRLNTQTESDLLTKAEYQMGVHKVIAKLSSGGMERGIVINSTIFLKEGEYPRTFSANWDDVLKEAAKSYLTVEAVTVIPREPATLKGIRQIVTANEKNHRLALRALRNANATYGRERERLLAESQQYEVSAKSAAAKDAPLTLTTAEEIFKRFSAFRNDKRVTPGGGLRAGTFATTNEDAEANIKTGTDAVRRYALDSGPASNVFTISPASDVDVQRGTVQPAHNQPGGGAEVIFVNALPDGTVTGPKTIPDK